MNYNIVFYIYYIEINETIMQNILHNYSITLSIDGYVE